MNRRSAKYWLKLAFKIILFGLVCWGIWHTLAQANSEFAEHDFDWSKVRWPWLLAAAACYLLGTLPMHGFWYATLRAMGQPVSWFSTFRAFYIGHLGKYVPGKATVIVLRTGLLMQDEVNVAVVATSVFVETLTMMAVGASVAAVILLFYAQHSLLFWLAVALMLCAGVPTFPPIFRRVLGRLQESRFGRHFDQPLQALNWRLMAQGWVTVAMGWVLVGMSLWCTMQSIPGLTEEPVSWSHLPLLTACVGLALIAGFLSLLPGGVGVREWIIVTLLAGTFGSVAAFVSAILLRLVWLATEVVLSAILYWIKIK